MVKGAALLLQEEGEPEEIAEPPQTSGPSEQELHLQSMLRLLWEEDTLKLAIRLEPVRSCLTRYLVVVSSKGRSTEELTILLGVDFAHDGSLLQMLHKACEAAEANNYIPGTSPGLSYYLDHHRSPQVCINAWTATSDMTSTRRDATTPER
ncbi:hypothetical protein GDO81_000003 [Engystomops pustulosus]|uniref:Slingshot N-terminal domain-containing protein n=1 Tax=Engystomops pustulosus TaxID=76066 RepID=A0AAV7D4R8_ENGPU|nr:hypothetical protein GDO81_000003 [Engystomops pustulosus]